MANNPDPSHDPRRHWTVIGAIASVARALIDAWRLFHDGC